MATWEKCHNKHGETIWVNLDTATMMMWRDSPEEGTEIVFSSGGHVVVREKPDDPSGSMAGCVSQGSKNSN